MLVDAIIAAGCACAVVAVLTKAPKEVCRVEQVVEEDVIFGRRQLI